ncbi:citrate synthase [Lentisphaerota bacterium WC36G]|nr:citrate synthase [Lentisphaerae bacterium WC36]
MSENFAELIIGGKKLELPIVEGTEGEKAIDISSLRRESGFITIDPSFLNTGACFSKITFIDGEKGILRYRGIPVQELAEDASFIETAYLLLHNEFPNSDQLECFSKLLTEHSMLHEDMRHFFDGFPRGAHPMHILSTMINALSTFYPNVDALSLIDDINVTAARLISVVRTMAAFAYKKSIGEPVVYPSADDSYCANFLHMMFDSPVKKYKVDKDIVKALNQLLILHADHEQNCSTTTVRTIGSAQVNLYATISAGISALSGPLHGGANQAVMSMLESIRQDGGDIEKYITMAKDAEDPFRLMGFGHRVYKNFDPRATIIKETCHTLLNKLEIEDELLGIAMQLEEVALEDPYFVKRKLYPNVDFYSGIIYKAMGIPENMFTVMFVLGRLPGWIAHWKEMISKGIKIARPRQIYTGKTLTHLSDIVK